MFVGSRDCSKLVAGVHKQTDLVGRALAGHGFTEGPIVGMLCFVEADWPLIGGPSRWTGCMPCGRRLYASN
jgi:hypothetical protein